MKIPASAMKSMMDMVVASLPYEDRPMPSSKEAILTLNVLDELTASDEQLQALEGFFNLIIKKMDECPKQQEAAKKLFINVHEMIEFSGILNHERIDAD